MKKLVMLTIAAFLLASTGAWAQSIGLGDGGVKINTGTGHSATVKQNEDGSTSVKSGGASVTKNTDGSASLKTDDSSDSSVKVDKSGATLQNDSKKKGKKSKQNKDEETTLIEGIDGTKLKTDKDGAAKVETKGGSSVKQGKDGSTTVKAGKNGPSVKKSKSGSFSVGF